MGFSLDKVLEVLLGGRKNRKKHEICGNQFVFKKSEKKSIFFMLHTKNPVLNASDRMVTCATCRRRWKLTNLIVGTPEGGWNCTVHGTFPSHQSLAPPASVPRGLDSAGRSPGAQGDRNSEWQSDHDATLAAFLCLTEDDGGTWEHAQTFVDDTNDLDDAVKRFRESIRNNSSSRMALTPDSPPAPTSLASGASSSSSSSSSSMPDSTESSSSDTGAAKRRKVIHASGKPPSNMQSGSCVSQVEHSTSSAPQRRITGKITDKKKHKESVYRFKKRLFQLAAVAHELTETQVSILYWPSSGNISTFCPRGLYSEMQIKFYEFLRNKRASGTNKLPNSLEKLDEVLYDKKGGAQWVHNLAASLAKLGLDTRLLNKMEATFTSMLAKEALSGEDTLSGGDPRQELVSKLEATLHDFCRAASNVSAEHSDGIGGSGGTPFDPFEADERKNSSIDEDLKELQDSNLSTPVLDKDLSPSLTNGMEFNLTFQNAEIGISIESTTNNYAMLRDWPYPETQAAKYDLVPGDYIIKVGTKDLGTSDYNDTAVQAFKEAWQQQNKPLNIVFFRFNVNTQFGRKTGNNVATDTRAAAVEEGGAAALSSTGFEGNESEESDDLEMTLENSEDEKEEEEDEGGTFTGGGSLAAAKTRNIFAFSSALYALALSIDSVQEDSESHHLRYTKAAWSADGKHVRHNDLHDYGWKELKDTAGASVWCCPHVTDQQAMKHNFNTFSSEDDINTILGRIKNEISDRKIWSQLAQRREILSNGNGYCVGTNQATPNQNQARRGRSAKPIEKRCIGAYPAALYALALSLGEGSEDMPGTWDLSGPGTAPVHVRHKDLMAAGWKFEKGQSGSPDLQEMMYYCPGVDLENQSNRIRNVSEFRHASDVSKILERIRLELPNQCWKDLSEEK